MSNTLVEHNNRRIADKFAEYITGETLRRFVAKKVLDYCGGQANILDGAAGSGQLEQFISIGDFYAVEIQSKACDALIKNYGSAIVINESFFNHKPSKKMDCAVMNPPFSLKFSGLTDIEKLNIRQKFPWKKSGVVDDVFILKAISEVVRFGVFICFPGIAYRKQEFPMRSIIGHNLAELITIENGFEDTKISVLLLVIDKEKSDDSVKTAIFDCKTGELSSNGCFKINDDFDWITAKDQVEIEKIDIDEINDQLDREILSSIDAHINLQLLQIVYFNKKLNILEFIRNVRDICNKYENEYFGKLSV